ncbi:MAG TPA: hypothetical protein VLG25_01245 [Patescibacteria group bacterium]|nr:hypothetical protein [Patescibacteria group bacterium]
MIKKLLDGMAAQRREQRRAELMRKLIRHEAKIGGELFGEVPEGNRREFFCLDEHTWVWHEEWVDKSGQRQNQITRYDVRPDTILKSQNGHIKEVTKEEADRLVEASKLYQQRIRAELYSFVG